MSSTHACALISITCCALLSPLLLWSSCAARKTPADRNAAENRAWLKWKAENNKTYTEEEEPTRRANWATKYHSYKSLKKQKAFTKGFTNEQGEIEFPIGAGGPNGLADLSDEELESLIDDVAEMTDEDWREFEASDFYQKIDFDDETAGIELEDNLEESDAATAVEARQRRRRDDNGEGHLDWRQKGFVSPVINQGNCHSSWAIAVDQAVEAAVKKVKGQLVPLSPQIMLECEDKWQGCWATKTTVQLGLSYVAKNGLGAAEKFPYLQPKRVKTCPAKGSYKNEVDRRVRTPQVSAPVWLIGGHVEKGNEEKLKRAVRLCGPVIATINVGKALTRYTKNDNIFADETACAGPGPRNNHAMLIVGYGTDPVSKQDYWLIKTAGATGGATTDT